MKSPITNHWHTHENINQKSCTPSCLNKKLYHPWANNDFYNSLLKQLTTTMDEDADDDENLRTNDIVICSECKVPSNRHDETAVDIIRAHPNFKPGNNNLNENISLTSPWHDWVEVEYEDGVACGKVMVWCWIHFDGNQTDQHYGLVQTLTGSRSKVKNLTIVDTYDRFVEGRDQIQFVPGSAIKSVAYVLPSIDYSDKDRKNYDQYFQSNLLNNSNFVVIKDIKSWK